VPLLDGSRNVFACWLGGEGVREADAIFTAAGIPTYATPESAVRGFLTLVKYRRNQERLMQTPPSIAEGFVPDKAAARQVIDAALRGERGLLSEYEAKQVLTAYGIPVVETRIAAGADEAAGVAAQLGFPVALKILSPDISHKSDVGGVALNLESAPDVRAAAEAMRRRCAERLPQARLTGFTVQQMVRRGGAHELILGAAVDRVFGPVILFGQGGTAVEAIADRAVELPPLNLALARELVQRTRVARLLAGYRDRPGADLSALHLALVKIAQLVADLPEVVELDVNPLLADEKGIVALDARMRVARTAAAGAERFAIRPYPAELEQWIEFGGRRVLLRPIRPEDEPQHRELLSRITLSDVQFRFFYARREFSHLELARFTQIDYDREMAFIATAEGAAGTPETLGVVRAIADPDNASAEFAILVRSDIKGQGLGRALLGAIIRYCRDRGTGVLVGEVLSSNRTMLALVVSLGFEVSRAPPDLNIVRVALTLNSGAEARLSGRA
jgi:acetyltransferase